MMIRWQASEVKKSVFAGIRMIPLSVPIHIRSFLSCAQHRKNEGVITFPFWSVKDERLIQRSSVLIVGVPPSSSRITPCVIRWSNIHLRFSLRRSTHIPAGVSSVRFVPPLRRFNPNHWPLGVRICSGLPTVVALSTHRFPLWSIIAPSVRM